MVPLRMKKEDFIAFREFYVQRLDSLRDEIIKLNVEAKEGLRGSCQTLSKMNEIDNEIKGIIECGTVINYLRGA